MLYENLPFIYFGISGFLLSYDTSTPMLIAAVMLYSAACATLVSRSAYRRRDSRKIRANQIPEIIYEYLPYTYAAIAIFTIMATSLPSLQFIAFIVIIFAFRNLLCRHNNRMKSPSLF